MLLTPAQADIARDIVDGLCNKQIAHKRGIQESTVKAHVSGIVKRTGATNRATIAVYYLSACPIAEREMILDRALDQAKRVAQQ